MQGVDEGCSPEMHKHTHSLLSQSAPSACCSLASDRHTTGVCSPYEGKSSTISACLLAEYMNAGQKEELSPAVQRF